MSKHTYTQHDEGVHWETHVSPSTLYGWFEHKVHGGDGGLWFGPRDDGTPGIMLIDFDGRAVLPIEVERVDGVRQQQSGEGGMTMRRWNVYLIDSETGITADEPVDAVVEDNPFAAWEVVSRKWRWFTLRESLMISNTHRNRKLPPTTNEQMAAHVSASLARGDHGEV